MADVQTLVGILLLALAVAALITLVVLLRKLKAIILQLYRRLDATTAEVAALRAQIAGAGQAIAIGVDRLSPATGADLAALRADLGSRADGLREAVAEVGQGLRADLAALARKPEAAPAGALLPALRPLQQMGALRLAAERAAVAGRIAVILGNQHVRDHLAALGEDMPAPAAPGYGFRRAVGAIAPRITRRGGSGLVVCSLAVGEGYAQRVAPALDSHRRYAEARGISHAVLLDPPSWTDRPPSWWKLPLVMALFEQGFGRVLFLDADALVTSLDFDPEAVFGARCPRGSLHLTEDEAGINCGVMFAEDGPAIRRLLELVWLFDAEPNQGTWEQHALKTLMDMFPQVARQVTIEPDPRRFNSFAPERMRFYRGMARSTWQAGDFVCHFSGIRPPHLEALLSDYATRIAPLPPREA